MNANTRLTIAVIGGIIAALLTVYSYTYKFFQ